MLDFIRIACAVNAVRVGDVTKNVADICGQIAQADEKGTDLVTFPEMALTGYTCADLFFQDTLLEACQDGLAKITACTAAHPGVTAVVGLPAVVRGQMYNCGAVIRGGKVRGGRSSACLACRRYYRCGRCRFRSSDGRAAA